MSSAIFLFDNQVDTATLTASSEVITVNNLKNPQRSKFWRSGGGSASYVSVTLSNVTGTDHIALVDLNLTTAGEIRIQAWSDALDGSVSTFDDTFTPTLYVAGIESTAYGLGLYGIGPYGSSQAVGQVNNRNITIIPLGLTLTSQYYKITFTDTNTDYQQCSKLYIGSSYSYTTNLAYGWSAERIERNEEKESIGGQIYFQPRDSKLRISGVFRFLSETERTDTLIRTQILGNRIPFIFSIFPEASNQGLTTTVYGRFDNKDISQAFQNINEFNFSVIEEL